MEKQGTALTEEGIEIYWSVQGAGTPLICSNGVGVGTFFWKYIIERYQEDFAVLIWDYRGHGRSQRDINPLEVDMSIPQLAKDFKNVFESAFPEYNGNFFLIGHSMGCQVNLEIYRNYRTRVSGIFHLLGTAGNALSTFGNFKYSPYVFRGIRRLTLKLGTRSNKLFSPLLLSPIAWPFATTFSLVDPIYTDYDDFFPYLEHLASLDMQLFVRAVWCCQEHSAWDILEEIHCPVLVFAAERDGFTPIECANRVSEAIPQGRLVILAEGSHAALIEQPEIINYHIDRFLEQF